MGLSTVFLRILVQAKIIVEIARTQYINTLRIFKKVMNLEIEALKTWGNVNRDNIDNKIHSIQL